MTLIKYSAPTHFLQKDADPDVFSTEIIITWTYNIYGIVTTKMK